MPNNIYQCQHCDSIRKSKNSLLAHESKCPKNLNRKVRFAICKHCHESFSKSNIQKHEVSCLKDPIVIQKHTRKCPECNQDFISRRGQISCSQSCASKQKHGQTAWNKGLTAETNVSVATAMNTRKDRHKKGLYDDRLSRPQTEETKQRISRARKKYLSENPDKVPYLLNHHSKGPSYPEKYWTEVLDSRDIIYEAEYRVGLYSLDFAIIDKKIDLEIDGNQHYFDKRIQESDMRRTKYLESLGWSVIRIRWSDYQKLSKEQRTQYVNDVIRKIS